MDDFSFTESPDPYMWYDITGNTGSHDPFQISCEGSFTTSASVTFHNSIYRMPKRVSGDGTTEIYDFDGSITSNKSGIYQCVIYNSPDKAALYQKTTSVLIAGMYCELCKQLSEL